ncbi:MAG: response regulator [Lachnospiraceae bacterium]|nr:response regulator [Lachnospiraceae bacterium]
MQTYKKIIIVDDNAANLSVGRNLLKTYYEVYPAPSAAKLFNIMDKIIPDLILLDVNMPEMNGYEAIKKLKADSRFAEIPVIFLTAKNDEESELEGFDLGAADYITKPFSGPLLLRRIANQLLLEQQKQDLLESQAALQDYAENLEIKVREKTAAKTIFLANMSHELRTPMNSIVGFSELALDDDINPKTKDYLTKILESSEWLLHIINDILDITNIESGKIDLKNVVFDLNEIINGCQTMFLPKATENGLMLSFYTDPSISKKLIGDPVRLRQVFINLLSNAIKFTASGSVEFQMEAKEANEKSVTVYFEIKDSGIGMTPEQTETIFNPFTQVDSGITRKYGGAGLGLTITKKIIEMMGGSITVESTPGAGSTFSFEITFAVIGEKEDSKINVMLARYKKPQFEGEVLICEDNIMNQHVICEYLAKVNLKTFVAENGKIGVDMIKSRMEKGEKQFDLIFMDIHMPVMSGIEAAEKILALDLDIPVVALTANVMPDDIETYKKTGMKECISKPFTSQELWRCLMNYFVPVTWQIEEKSQLVIEEDELRQKLIGRFVENYRDAFWVITAAINDGDISLAHRITHNLKSNAGQLNKKLLQKAAEEVEHALKNSKNLVAPQQMEIFEKELNAAIKEFSPLVRPPASSEVEYLEAAAAKEILTELKPLLNDNDSDCLAYIDDLHSIPGSKELIRQMENFEFKLAAETLTRLLGE